MLIAAFTLTMPQSLFAVFPLYSFFSLNHLHAAYNTHIAPLSKAVAWSRHEGTTSQRGADNKRDSYTSSGALSVSIRENVVFTSTVVTETAAFQLYECND